LRTISSVNVREALTDNLDQISAAVLRALERTPPELGADVLERGIMMTGGGAMLEGIDKMLRDRVELPVYVAEDPLTAVVRGTGEVLENLEDYKRVLT
jgi:rod shape-determining protein MreB